MSTPAPTTTARATTQPPWRAIPGGPPEPNFQAQRAAVQAVNSERTKLFDRLDAVRARLDALAPTSDAPPGEDEERRALRAQLSDLVSQQRHERTLRDEKRKEMNAARAHIDAIKKQLQATQKDVGVFDSLEDIDRARALLMRRLETNSGGGLRKEKATVQRLQQLEAARDLLAKIVPLEAALDDAETQKSSAAKEYEAVIARLDALNRNYEERLQEQQRLIAASVEAGKAANPRAERNALLAERRAISAELTACAERLKTLNENFDAQLSAWREWKTKAQEMYREKMERQRAEAAERRAAQLQQRKEEQRMRQLAKARNPHSKEIGTCAALLRYLTDRRTAIERDRAAAVRREKALAMAQDASRLPPPELQLLKPKDEDVDSSLQELRKKKSKGKKSKESERDAAAAATTTPATKPMHHSAEKLAMFTAIGVEPPSSSESLEKAIAAVTEKLKYYESKIVPEDVEIPQEDLPPLSDQVEGADDSDEGVEEQRVAEGDGDVAAAPPQGETSGDAAAAPANA